MKINALCIANGQILHSLQNIFDKTKKIKKIRYENNLKTAFQNINKYKPDLIFCEVNQELFKQINYITNKNYQPCFVFFSEEKRFSHKIIKYNFDKYFLISYILTPITEEKIANSLEKYYEFNFKNLIKENKEAIIETFYSKIKINIDDIYYITRSGQYTLIKTIKKDYLSKCSLKEFGKKFEKYNFKRIQKSYVVNMNNIKEIKKITSRKYFLILKEINKKIKVGRAYISKIDRL